MKIQCVSHLLMHQEVFLRKQKQFKKKNLTSRRCGGYTGILFSSVMCFRRATDAAFIQSDLVQND